MKLVTDRKLMMKMTDGKVERSNSEWIFIEQLQCWQVILVVQSRWNLADLNMGHSSTMSDILVIQLAHHCDIGQFISVYFLKSYHTILQYHPICFFYFGHLPWFFAWFRLWKIQTWMCLVLLLQHFWPTFSALKLLDSCFSPLSDLLFINFRPFWMLTFPILMHLELLLTTFNHLVVDDWMLSWHKKVLLDSRVDKNFMILMKTWDGILRLIQVMLFQGILPCYVAKL